MSKPDGAQAMTSHTPQPPAGDDLVARVARAIDPDWWAWADRHFDEALPGDDKLMKHKLEQARRAIEALTSQQHTEAVAGEVEVVGYTGERMLNSLRIMPHTGQYIFGEAAALQADVPLVRKSSYDALASAKDAAIYKLRLAFDAMAEEVEIGEQRALAAERQRDALWEALAPFAKAAPHYARTGYSDEQWVINQNSVSSRDGYTEAKLTRGDFRRALAALKDEGGARP